MGVVDNLDERLDLAALGLAGFSHAAGDLQRVALDAGDECVWEGMLLAAGVLGLEDDDLLPGVATAGDDGLEVNCVSMRPRIADASSSYHSANFEDCEDVSIYITRSIEMRLRFIATMCSSVCDTVAERPDVVATLRNCERWTCGPGLAVQLCRLAVATLSVFC